MRVIFFINKTSITQTTFTTSTTSTTPIMSTTSTIMATEARAAATVVTQQLQENTAILLKLCEKIYTAKPSFVVTIGRGSSDHACTYAKYLCETKLGLITSSAAPSVVTVYHADLNFEHALVIGISQSGKSPDICCMMENARRKGAITVAIVNDVQSPLAQHAEFVIPMLAGEERAVAATKSYIASLSVLAHFIALITNDVELLQGCQKLPLAMHEIATSLHWSEFIDNFRAINNTLIIGRGYGLPIAQEIALKFKETAGIQAEAFSAAELLHGPLALIKPGHPYLLLAQNDDTLKEILTLALRIKNLGGKSLLLVPQEKNAMAAKAVNEVTDAMLTQHTSAFLVLPQTLGAIFDPIIAVQALHLLIAELAVSRGYNPDQPANLCKITETL